MVPFFVQFHRTCIRVHKYEGEQKEICKSTVPGIRKDFVRTSLSTSLQLGHPSCSQQPPALTRPMFLPVEHVHASARPSHILFQIHLYEPISPTTEKQRQEINRFPTRDKCYS